MTGFATVRYIESHDFCHMGHLWYESSKLTNYREMGPCHVDPEDIMERQSVVVDLKRQINYDREQQKNKREIKREIARMTLEKAAQIEQKIDTLEVELAELRAKLDITYTEYTMAIQSTFYRRGLQM